jgi:hypothetical protein
MTRFYSVDDYVSQLPQWMQERFMQIRQLISTFPEIKETIRYNTAFFDYKGMMLYMGSYKKKRMVLGFCNGKLLTDDTHMLIADAGQANVKHWELFEYQTPDFELMATYIIRAMQIRDYLSATKYAEHKKM